MPDPITYDNATHLQIRLVEHLIHRDLGPNQTFLVNACIQSDEISDEDLPSREDYEKACGSRVPEGLSAYDYAEMLRENDPDAAGFADPWNCEDDELGDVFWELTGEAPDPEWSSDELREWACDEAEQRSEDYQQKVLAEREDNAEVVSWFAINNDSLIERLKAIGEVVLEVGNNAWWGRQAGGQAISLDNTFWEIYQERIVKAKYALPEDKIREVLDCLSEARAEGGFWDMPVALKKLMDKLPPDYFEHI